jgi:uncharacterized membrane protein
MSNDTAPRPTAFGSYGYGWQQFRKYFLHLFLVALIGGIMTFPNWLAGPGYDSAAWVPLQILVAAYGLLIMPVINYGIAYVFLRYIRNENADIREIFQGFSGNYLNIVLANLLVVAIVIVGFILLIVPGIVFMVRLMFVQYLVMDKGLDPVAAIEKSWNMTRGYGWRIFGMLLLAIPIMLIGFCLLIVGAFFAWIWIAAAFAAMYYAVDREEQRRLDENGSAAPVAAQ